MTTLTIYNLTPGQLSDVQKQAKDANLRNLSIYDLTPGQIAECQRQLEVNPATGQPPGSGMPPPPDTGGSAPIVPGGTPADEAAIAALKAAPSDWAAYTFITSKEAGALTNLYGSAAVNNVINFYNATYHMNGYLNPNPDSVNKRADTTPGPYQYFFRLDQEKLYEEDTGQADQYLYNNYSHQTAPKLPCRP